MTLQHWRHFDPVLLVTTLALAGYGALLIYSADYPRGSVGIVITEPVWRHIASAGVGALLMVALSRFDYRRLDLVGWFAYGLGIVLLLAVLVIGAERFGSRRWFDLGVVLIQASEIAKILTIMGLAKFMADYHDRFHEWRVFLASLGLVLIPILLIMAQPDLGSASLFLVIWGVMAAFAGARLKQFTLLGLLLVALVPFGLLFGIAEYQRDRITIFLDPADDPLGGGFNILQAETSVGSGGLLGKGLTQGTQVQLDFLQTQTTDFIFSVLGEELGFVGAMALFALFLLLIVRGLRAILHAPEPLGQLLVAGIVTMIAIQAFIAVAVNIRLVPVTGVPLPFISVGNSSLVVMFLALGIVQSVLARQDDSTL